MISAAHLRKAGHNVTIVEADNRVGGRCMTFRNTPDKRYFEDSNLTAEAGAMRIPDMHKLVHHLIDYTEIEKQLFLNSSISHKDALSGFVSDPELYSKDDTSGAHKYFKGDVNIDKGVFPDPSGNNFVHVNYHHISRKTYESTPDIAQLLEYDLTGDEKGRARQLLDAKIGWLMSLVNENPLTAWPYIINAFGEFSMRRFLKEDFNKPKYQGQDFQDSTFMSPLSENAIEFIGVMENLESRMSYSFIQSFIELAIIKPTTPFWLIKGGTDKLTDAYYQKENLEQVTFLNQTLTDLYRTDCGKIKIKTKVSNVSATDSAKDQGVQRMLASREWDEVIVTIPFSCFRLVHVWPKFSQGKRQAVRELHYDAATKILLEFRERFWETDQEIFGGGSVTDLPNRFMYYPSERMGSNKGGILLASYSWADDARKWDSMTEYDRFCYALDNVAITHAVHADDATYDERIKAQQRIKDLCVFDPELYKDDQDQIIGAATISWMNNPYAFGEAAIYYPGQLDLFHRSITRSEWDSSEGQPIAHFAGEHASLKHAWIEGAIESALHSALVVNENDLPTLSIH